MDIKTTVNGKQYNTFSIDLTFDRFCEITSVDQLQALAGQFDFKSQPFYLLGEGSNTLFTGDYHGLIILMKIPGVEVLEEDENSITFEVGAGENWHKFVMYVSQLGYSGVENLAYIPGTVGAAPVQNIAAYGQVFEDLFQSLDAVDLRSGQLLTIQKDWCDFRYRYSAFKEPENKYLVVTKVRIKLSKEAHFDTSYHSRYANESLQEWLRKSAKEPYTPLDVANAVINLRKYKLPQIEEYGTCGSFFINPFVSIEKYEELLKKIPDLQSYPVTKMDYSRTEWDQLEGVEQVKIPAGRLLDYLGWKNRWIGNVGTFERHALCVVTNKKASGEDVLRYIEMMREDVQKEFGITLKSEVVIV